MKKLFCMLLLSAGPLLAQAQDEAPLPDPRPAVLAPNDKIFIKDYISRYRKGMVNLQKDKVILMRYFEQTLAKNGVPKELKNLAIVESYLERRSTSTAGAAGPWQLMEGTARGSGLIVTDTLDERFDVYKSTRVAVSLLKHLHRKYNDWHLVVAAYNAGSGRVDNAIKQARSNIYWDVEKYLPAETRGHVKKFMASSFALDGKIPEPTRYQTGGNPTDTLAVKGLLSEPVNAGFRLDVIAEKLEIPEDQVRRWNGNYESALSRNGNAQLILPRDKMPDFIFRKSEILKASLEKTITENSNPDE